jgi:pyruvate kinase
MNPVKTKIVCTIGPSTWEEDVVRQMIEHGMTCARVNGAFADPDELDKVRTLIRNISNEVILMVDVKGPEIRLNKFENPRQIKPDDQVIIGIEGDEIYPANYQNVHTFVQPGQRILIGDGDVELRVERIEDRRIICKVVYGEVLKPGKAMNMPGVNHSEAILTDKDKENLIHSINTGWDMVSASFMQNVDSAKHIRQFINENGGEGKMKIIAKIEDKQGIENIDSILEHVDGVMIARGGLGVELGLAQVPHVQRLLTKKCNEAGKPVITATQMLESMTDNPSPTRAEVSDVATAILLGSDAVMLSGESSAGDYPIESVKMLESIARETEQYLEPHIIKAKAHSSSSADAITKAAAEMCIGMEDELSAIIVVSKSGLTSRLLARHNIKQPIYLFTSNEHFARTGFLTKNIIRSVVFEGLEHNSEDYNRDRAIGMIIDRAKEQGFIQTGQKILLIGKTPIDQRGYFPNVFEIIDIA